MESQSHPQTTTFAVPPGTVSRCPFHDGPLTLDLLLAELGPEDAGALDLALDLRSAVTACQDPAACVDLALRLRHALDGRHYLAFYRVRLWLQRVIIVQVRAWRGEPWESFGLPLNSARRDEIENLCLAAWSADRAEGDVAWAQLRFVFRSALAPAPVTGAAALASL